MTADVMLDTNAVSDLGKRISPALNRRASEYVATRGRLATPPTNLPNRQDKSDESALR